MADLRATFEADFASFYDACKQAVVELKSFETGASQVEDKLDRMTNKFSGQKVIQDAQLMTEAIERLGGVSTLTEAELARVGKVANEAVEKMRAIGMDVPKGMQALADATKGAGAETASLTSELGGLVAAYVSVEAVLHLAEAAWTAVVDLMRQSVQAAADAEEADAALNAALAAQGQAVPSVTEAYHGYAAALQQTTRYSDDALTAAEAMLAQLGNIGPAQMQKALEATTNLAAGMRIDLASAATLVAKAAEGQTTALHKAGVQFDEAAAKSGNFVVVLDAINAKFPGVAAAMGDTFTGRIAKMGNAWDNVLESVGRVITTNETLRQAISGVTDLLTAQTGELNSNAAMERVVSDAVILTVDAMDLLVKGLDLAVGFFADYQKRQAESALTMLAWGRAALEAAKALQEIEAAMPGAMGEAAQRNAEQLEGAIIGVAFQQQALRQSITDTAAVSAEWHERLTALDAGLQSLSGRLEKTAGQTTAAAKASTELAAGFERVTLSAAAMFGAAGGTGTAEDPLTKRVKAQLDALIELNSVSTDFHATVAALNPELVAEVEHYLDAGVAATTLATALNLTASQVAAITKLHKEEIEQQKAAEAYAATNAKLDLELSQLKTEASHNSIEARIADEEKWGEAQKRVLDKAHQATEETYGKIDAIVEKSVDLMNQKMLEADPNTKAHFQKLKDEAEAAWDFAQKHMDQYTNEELIKLQDAAIAADEAFKDWENSARNAMDGAGEAAKTSKDLINDTTNAVKDNGVASEAVANRVKESWATVKETWVGVAGAVREATEAYDALNDMAGRSGTVPGGGNNANVTNWYDTQAGRSMSFQTMMLNKSYQESGIAFAPGRASGGSVSGGSAYVVGERGPELFVPGAGGGTIVPNGGGGGGGAVVIQAGAFVFNTPIMDTPQAMDKIVRMVGEAFVTKATRSGARL